MIVNTHFIKATVRHHFKASYWRGHGVHSPFVYHLVRHIITTRKVDRELRASTRAYRASLVSDKTMIDVSDCGVGCTKTSVRSVSRIAQRASVAEKYGLLLARLVEEYKPQTIVELGTSLGISTQYMARKIGEGGRVITIEGSKACADIATKRLSEAGLDNVDVRVGSFDDTYAGVLDEISEADFVFVDGNHTYEATKRYFEMTAKKATSKTIIVFDDIHWSPGMSKAWDEISSDQRVMTSMDLLHMGIVFFRTGCQKESYRLRW